MSFVNEITISTISEYLEQIERLRSSTNDTLWFRGCKNSKFKLVPSLYRHKSTKNPKEINDLENKLITRFRQRSIPYISRQLIDDWEALFFMQHYGIPTRLLDWSENPLTALHFSLIFADHKILVNGDLRFLKTSSVWVLNPIKWNRHVLEHISYTGGILTPEDGLLNVYKPFHDNSVIDNLPLALYGSYNSPRIVAQQGVFTIFGQNTNPMEAIFTEKSFPNDCLLKFNFPKEEIPDIRCSLLNLGVTESVVFPDLDGLAKEIKRSFNFQE